MTRSQAGADPNAGDAYGGKPGATRTESLQLRQVGGALRSVDVYRVVNVGTDPALKTRVLNGELNRLEDGAELAVTFVYHDPAARRFALVIPRSLAHLELKERARLMSELADDAEHLVPEYVREGVTVLGLEELSHYLGEPASRADQQRGPDAGPNRERDRYERPLAEQAMASGPAALDPSAAPMPRVAPRRVSRSKSGWLAGVTQLLQSWPRRPSAADVAAERLLRAALTPAQRTAFSATQPSTTAAATSPAHARTANSSTSPAHARTANSSTSPAHARTANSSTTPAHSPTAPRAPIAPRSRGEPRSAPADARRGLEAHSPPSAVRGAPSAHSPPSAVRGAPSAHSGAAAEESPADVDVAAPASTGLASVRFRPSLRSAAVKAASLQRASRALSERPSALGAASDTAVNALQPTSTRVERAVGEGLAQASARAPARPGPARDRMPVLPAPVQPAAELPTPELARGPVQAPTVASAVLEPAGTLAARLERLPLLGMTLQCEPASLQLFVKLDQKRAGVFDDEAELLVQWAQVAGRPIVVLAVIGEGKSIARMALDGLAAPTLELLQRLGRDFRAQLVTSVEGELGEPRAIIAPREFNARAIAARLAGGSFQPECAAQLAIARCLAEPPPVRVPDAPFGPARLPPASTANVLAAVMQLDQWQEPGRLSDAMLVYSVPKHVIDAWQRRVLRSAHGFGIALPERVLPLVREQELARDLGTFVREQLTAFRNRVERGQNDLDPAATEANWERLMAQAAALGIPVDPSCTANARGTAADGVHAQS